MSFAHLSSLESQPTTSTDTGYSDDPEFKQLTTSLSARLFTLTSNITKLNSQLSLLGTKKDSEAVRDRLKVLLDETRNGFRDIGDGVKRVQSWEDVSPQQKFTQGKISQQFTSALSDFQALQRLAAEKQRQYVMQARQALEDPSSVGDPNDPTSPTIPLVQQEQAQLQLADQSEVDFQESLIIEREEEIRGIEEGIQEINEIFRDLGTMVEVQGENVSQIWTNVQNVRDDTRGASQELTSAARYQKNARNRACCLFLILTVVSLVILLAAFAG